MDINGDVVRLEDAVSSTLDAQNGSVRQDASLQGAGGFDAQGASTRHLSTLGSWCGTIQGIDNLGS